MPHYFPLNDSTAHVSPKWRRFNRSEVLVMRDAGLLQCVDAQRKLWMYTHRANVLTRDCIQRTGGKISTALERSIQDSMAALMARGVEA